MLLGMGPSEGVGAPFHSCAIPQLLCVYIPYSKLANIRVMGAAQASLKKVFERQSHTKEGRERLID